MSTLRQAVPRSHIGLPHATSVQEVYPAVPVTVPRARHLVTSALNDWGLAATRSDAAMVAAELTANAVVQGGSTLPAEVLVRVSWTPRYVVIQVGDHNPAGPQKPPRTITGTAEHGRGLLISRALSARLAWCRQGDWKVVWAALSKPPTREGHETSRGQLGKAA
jgi:hypothetical protein